MKIVLLGTTGYHPNERRHTACMLLPECGVMFDAGTAIFRAAEYLKGAELDIFLSHAHIDHVVGLTYLFNVIQEHPLEKVRVHATAKKLAAIDEHLFCEDIFPMQPPYERCPLDESAGLELCGGGRMTHFPLKHQGGSVGYRLDWSDRSMAYVTDTCADPTADYVQKIRGVDLLLHECYFPDDNADWAKTTGHSHTSAVAEVAREAGVGQLVLVHINPLRTDDDPIGLDVARTVFPATEIGQDLMEIEF